MSGFVLSKLEQDEDYHLLYEAVQWVSQHYDYHMIGELDYDAFYQKIRHWQTNKQNSLVILKKDREFVGVIVGSVGERLFKKEHIVAVQLFFVMPKFRGTTAALRLMTYLKRWAKAYGAKTILTSVVEYHVDGETPHRFFEKLGGRYVGNSYAFDVV